MFSSLEKITNLSCVPDYINATDIYHTTTGGSSYTLPEDGYIRYQVTQGTIMISATINGKNDYRFGCSADTNYSTGGMVYMPKGSSVKRNAETALEASLEFIPLK